MQRLTSALALSIVLCLSTWTDTAAQPALLGDIAFPNSGSKAAQPDFIRGVLLLHSFEYDDSAEAFRAAQEADPDFALAYWGEALTYNHPLWYQHDREAALAALGRLGKTKSERIAKAPTEREKMYMEAVEVLYGDGDLKSRNEAYSEAMRSLSERFPDDLEAKAFHALSILGTSTGGRDFAVYMKAAAKAAEVFTANPQHPGAAHYLIHSFDDPIHAPLGLPAARAYSEIAPSAAHALHMPSHIFVALGMWEDVAAMNVRSWEAGAARVERKNLDLSENEYHAIMWNSYARLQMGQYEEARRLIAIVEDHLERQDHGGIRYHLGMMRAAYLVEADPGDESVRSIELDYSRMSDQSAAASMFADGFAALADGDVAAAESKLESMRARRIEASKRADGADAASADRLAAEHTRVLIMEKELEALLAAHRGNMDDAIGILRTAADMEEALNFQFGPPVIVKPAPELLGDVLLQAGRHAEAEAAYERSLKRAPGRAASLRGLSMAAGS